MARFRDAQALQKLAVVCALTHNHFKLERHLNHPNKFKHDRAAALAEWRQFAA